MEEIKQKIAMEARKDESFKNELLKNPTEAIKNKFAEWGLDWPQNCIAYVHVDSETEIHFVISKSIGGITALGKEELAEVTGGAKELLNVHWEDDFNIGHY